MDRVGGENIGGGGGGGTLSSEVGVLNGDVGVSSK